MNLRTNMIKDGTLWGHNVILFEYTQKRLNTKLESREKIVKWKLDFRNRGKVSYTLK